jgi:hypothetical protein
MGVQFASASVSQLACPQSSPIALIKVGFIGIALKGKVHFIKCLQATMTCFQNMRGASVSLIPNL